MSKAARSPKVKSKIREYISSFLVALVCFLLIRTSVVEAYRIPSGSMENTLLIGDFLLANKFIYGVRIPLTEVRLPAIRNPRPGDIVIFQSPIEEDKTLIKRCVAVEGQTVEVQNNTVYVDGSPKPLPEEGKVVESRQERGGGFHRSYGPVKVQEGHLFVMGDNRSNSLDSRYFGPIPRKSILGEAMIIYFSWSSESPLWDLAHKVRWSRLARIIR